MVGPVNNATMDFVGQHWGYEPSPGIVAPFLRSVPIVTVRPSIVAPATPPNGESFDYIVNFIQFTQDGVSGTEWVEFPYLPRDQPTFTYGGWADVGDPIHFTSNEIQLSPTLIPLDDLNFADDPLAGGTMGPAFNSVALPADVVPEPAPGALAVVVGAIALGWRMRARPTATASSPSSVSPEAQIRS